MEKFKEAIEKEYGFFVKTIDLIRSSDDNDTYKITTERGIYFGRFGKREIKDLVETGFELRFLHYLQNAGLPVAGVIPNKIGDLSVVIGNKTGAVFEWITGESTSVSPGNYLSAGKVYQAGKTLAALHNASATYDVVQEPKRMVITELERVVSLRDEVVGKYENGDEFIDLAERMIEFAHSYSDRGSILIHNDYRPHNVLFGTGGSDAVVGVVDFDWICKAPPIKDLALALVEWSFADGDNAFHHESFVSFLRGYQEFVADRNILKDFSALNQWIQFSCLSDAATYVSDCITSEKERGVLVHEQPKILKSYMLSKLKHFGTVDIKDLLADNIQ